LFGQQFWARFSGAVTRFAIYNVASAFNGSYVQLMPIRIIEDFRDGRLSWTFAVKLKNRHLAPCSSKATGANPPIVPPNEFVT